MPQIEASACGVPVAATDYSAMYDVVRLTKGYPIPVRTFFKEMETNAERAYPDNQEFAEILIKFFSRPESERLQESVRVRQATLERYDWDKSVKVWENYIDSYEPQNLQGKWNHPPRLINIPTTIPSNLSNEQFVRWIFTHVIAEPHKIHTEEAMSLCRNLKYGATVTQGGLQPTNPTTIFEQYKNRAQQHNSIELLRGGKEKLQPQRFFMEAYQRYEKVNK